MNNGFFIKGIKIQNFRGYEQQEFSFFHQKESMKGLILLGGPNGYGKTSLLDAMEWCMTGSIQRVVEDYEIRKEKNKKMQKCLLRHNGSKKQVSVLMDIVYLNNDLEIERIYMGDNESNGFFPENTIFKVNGKNIEEKNTIDYILNQSISKEFYERYTSSYEKNIRVYEKSRNDIYDMFSAFFGGTKEVETIIYNLDGYPGKNNRKGLVEQLNNQIIEEFKPNFDIAKGMYIEAEKKQKELLEERNKSGDVSINIKDYPKEQFYNQEVFPQDLLSIDTNFHDKIVRIKKQIFMFKEFKYLKEKKAAYKEVDTYLNQLRNQKELQDFNKQVENPFKLLREELISIQGKTIENLVYDKNIQEGYKREVSSFKNSSKEGVEKLKAISSIILDKNDRELSTFATIVEYYSNLESLVNQLEGFKSSDDAINALRSLIDHSQGFFKLREDGQEVCPLCGSKELFPIESNELVRNARKILGEVDSKRSNLQKSSNEQKEHINVIYNQFVKYLLNSIDTKIISLNNLLTNFDKTKKFKSACSSFKLNYHEVNDEIIQNKRRELESRILDDLEFYVLETSILDLLINEKGELDPVPSKFSEGLMNRDEFVSLDTIEKIESLLKFKESYRKKTEQLPNQVTIDSIKIEKIIKKLTILDEIETNLVNDKILKESHSDLDKRKKILNQHEELLMKKQNELKALKEISLELKKKRKQWDRQMVEEIRSPLQQIYRRINRHTNIEEINLIMDGTTKTKASLMATISNEEVSATNILSAGQLSVVALSIFLTVAMGQKNNVFKCYFMDDPIQTMDDLNILSFIDLLRTELSNEKEENRFFDQLFFTTCDENLENLIVHKMKNFGINYSHIHFTGYGEYESRV
ncbi:AAA family ATPase [Fictibacillus sp. WQ 8-8]|uniref:AAA family ATPase n=1 Tax=Fictibacillus sp. WQ 8-8 TaxID=2938788 RepID=UPI00210C5335|nr:AAA family ATPase [Fictibacillus sp. WQ 8-8]MCQ6266312.1 AAA family ATPase [Fictibacillus sp. WQ 8-8]